MSASIPHSLGLALAFIHNLFRYLASLLWAYISPRR
jgi:hypothetical protein